MTSSTQMPVCPFQGNACRIVHSGMYQLQLHVIQHMTSANVFCGKCMGVVQSRRCMNWYPEFNLPLSMSSYFQARCPVLLQIPHSRHTGTNAAICIPACGPCDCEASRSWPQGTSLSQRVATAIVPDPLPLHNMDSQHGFTTCPHGSTNVRHGNFCSPPGKISELRSKGHGYYKHVW
jgi:hypothetical protein